MLTAFSSATARWLRRASYLSFVGVNVLPRHSAFRDQRVVPIVSQPRHVAIGFALLQIRLRLFQRGLRLFHIGLCLLYLMIELGRFNLGENLAFLHAIADID